MTPFVQINIKMVTNYDPTTETPPLSKKLPIIPLDQLDISQDTFDPHGISFCTEATTKRHSKDDLKTTNFLTEEIEEDENGQCKTEGDALWDDHTDETMSAKDHTDSEAAGQVLPLERFVGEVDNFFICARCKGVVDCPRECERCENLICEGCTDDECPYGCEVLETKDPALYARIVYSRLQVKCKYFNNGCEFFECIAVVKDHEQACLMRIGTCSSPLCNNMYRVFDRPEGERDVCSPMCNTVYQFSITLSSADRASILTNFCIALTSVKVQLRDELKAELAHEHRLLDLEREALSEQEEERIQLTKELHLRMISVHPGKWNQHGKMWSCCRSCDKYAIGCRELQT